MIRKTALFVLASAFLFSMPLCFAQKKNAPQPKEETVEIKGMILSQDGKTLIKAKPYVQNANIPDGVKIINAGAFSNSRNLDTVTFPASVEEIGEIAFGQCSKLKEVILPDGLKKIQPYTFFNCSGLTSLTIPDSVEEIGEGAFFGCSGLEELTLPKKLKVIHGKTFLHVKKVTVSPEQTRFTVTEEGVLIDTKEKKILFAPQTLSGTYEIPQDIKTIGAGAFYDCAGLNKVIVSEGVETIEAEAFGKCKSLYELVLPEGLKKIDNRAFVYCQKLSGITLPATVESLGKAVFYNCISIRSLELPESLQTIAPKAFSGTPNLKTITVPQQFNYKQISTWDLPRGYKIIRPPKKK